MDSRSWGRRWQGNTHAVIKVHPLGMRWEHTSYLGTRALNSSFDSAYWCVIHCALCEFHWSFSVGLYGMAGRHVPLTSTREERITWNLGPTQEVQRFCSAALYFYWAKNVLPQFLTIKLPSCLGFSFWLTQKHPAVGKTKGQFPQFVRADGVCKLNISLPPRGAHLTSQSTRASLAWSVRSFSLLQSTTRGGNNPFYLK